MGVHVTPGSVQDIIESVESIDFKDKRFCFKAYIVKASK